MQRTLSPEKKDTGNRKPTASATSELNVANLKNALKAKPISVNPFRPTLAGSLSNLKRLVVPSSSAHGNFGDTFVVGALVAVSVGLVLSSAEEFLTGLVKAAKDKISWLVDGLLEVTGIRSSPGAAEKYEGTEVPSGKAKAVTTTESALSETTPVSKPGRRTATSANQTPAAPQEVPAVAPPMAKAGAPISSAVKLPAVTLASPARTSTAAEQAPREDIGFVSRKEESDGGPGTVSSGKGDAGGVSYGTYQLSSTKGSAAEFVAKSQFKDYFKGLKPGTAQFSAAWVKVYTENPVAFAAEQQAYAVNKYYTPVIKSDVARRANLANRGTAIQEMVVSTSIQYGVAGARNIIEVALGDVEDPAKLTEVAIIQRVQLAKKKRLEALPVKDKKDNRAGLYKRIAREQDTLISIASGTTPTTVASAAPVRSPSALSGVGTAVPIIPVTISSVREVSSIKVAKSSPEPIAAPKMPDSVVGQRSEEYPNRSVVASNNTPEALSPAPKRNNETPIPFRTKSGQLAIAG